MRSTSVEFRCDDGLDIQSPAATSLYTLPAIRPSSAESALQPILDAETLLDEIVAERRPWVRVEGHRRSRGKVAPLVAPCWHSDEHRSCAGFTQLRPGVRSRSRLGYGYGWQEPTTTT